MFVCLSIDHIPAVPSDMVKCLRCGERLWRTRAEPEGDAICFPCCFAAIRRDELSAKDFGTSPGVVREACRELGLEPRDVRDLGRLIAKAAERHARRAQ